MDPYSEFASPEDIMSFYEDEMIFECEEEMEDR